MSSLTSAGVLLLFTTDVPLVLMSTEILPAPSTPNVSLMRTDKSMAVFTGVLTLSSPAIGVPQSADGTAFGSGSQGLSGSVLLATSLPSFNPSPSVSGFALSVPAANSPAFVRPSLSQSLVASAFILGSQGLSGSVVFATSLPSLNPSPSVSGLVLFVPAVISPALVKPSSSQSLLGIALIFGLQGSRGSEPLITSLPSVIRSLSVSGSLLSVPAAVSPALVSPSLSQSLEDNALISGSQGLSGSVLFATSLPSLNPSPSVSGFVLSVPATISPALFKPSLSQSLVARALILGSQGLSGLLPLLTSSPSLMVSSSVSGSLLLVPARISPALFKPSLSQSLVGKALILGSQGLSGLLSLFTSSPSLIKSLSVSGSLLSVPARVSPALVSPSLSQSLVGRALMLGSQGLRGLVLLVTSLPSLKPSPSVSGLVLSVPAVISPALLSPSLSQSFVGSALILGSQGSSGSVPFRFSLKSVI